MASSTHDLPPSPHAHRHAAEAFPGNVVLNMKNWFQFIPASNCRIAALEHGSEQTRRPERPEFELDSDLSQKIVIPVSCIRAKVICARHRTASSRSSWIGLWFPLWLLLHSFPDLAMQHFASLHASPQGGLPITTVQVRLQTSSPPSLRGATVYAWFQTSPRETTHNGNTPN